MTPHVRSRPAPRWPFWLLIVAWVCANGPQMACFEVVTWMKGASHFSHQMRLAQSAAELLGGEEESPARLEVAQAAAEPARPAIPPEATMKKIELAVPECRDDALAGRRVDSFPEHAVLEPTTVAADVPHPPPRGRA